MDKLQGIDVSEANGVINWEEVNASGQIHFAYIKATEGTTLQDSRFKANHNGAKAAGIPCGPYHFLHFATSPIESQAANFLTTISGSEGTLIPMVDVESGGQDGVTDVGILVHRLSTFLQIVEKTLKNQKVLIYTNYSFWGDVFNGTDCFSGHPLFVAAYENISAGVPIPKGFSSAVLWQHTDSYPVEGISSPVDGDLLLTPINEITRII